MRVLPTRQEVAIKRASGETLNPIEAFISVYGKDCEIWRALFLDAINFGHKITPTIIPALKMIRDLPISDQDNMLSANMRKIAAYALKGLDF